MIKIDKNVPIPKKKAGRYAKYPWDTMEVGDSFLCESKGAGWFLSMRTVHANARYKPKRFIRRAEGNAYRVWRVNAYRIWRVK